MTPRNEFNSLMQFSEIKEVYLNKKILLVTGKKSFEKSGAMNVCDDHLGSEEVIRFSDFSVNPKISDAIRGAELAVKNKIEVIIAIGGGSVLDMAKLIKAFFNSKGNEVQLAKGEDKVIDPSIPLIVIPTTAGSGSEATHFAVVYIGKNKYSLAAQCLKPTVTILDGSLVMSGGKYLKACNALDAMAQAIESFWAAGSTLESKRFAVEALKLGWDVLPRYVKDNCSLSDAQKMLEAANMAGKAINISKTTAAHAWSYAITSGYGVPHGHAVWLTLPAIFETHARSSALDVTDSRGFDYIAKVMHDLCDCLSLHHEGDLQEQLTRVLKQIGVEPDMERVGINSSEKKSAIFRQVNMERMSNNPVNLSRYETKIFRCD